MLKVVLYYIQHVSTVIYIDIVQHVMSSSTVDKNTKTFYGYTPLHGFYTVYIYEQRYSNKIKYIQYTYMRGMVKNQYIVTCRYFCSSLCLSLRVVAVRPSYGYTPLHTACRYGYLDIVHSILYRPTGFLLLKIIDPWQFIMTRHAFV